MPQRRAAARKWLIAAAKTAIVAAVAWGMHGAVRSAVDDLGEQHWRPSDLRPGWLAVSAALYLAGLAPSLLFWRRILATLGRRPALWPTARAYYIGHLGKYVPGKALVIVLRAGLLRGEGVKTADAVASVFLETLSMMAAGAVVAGALLAVWWREQWELTLLAAALAIAAGAPTYPPVFARLARLAGIERTSPGAVERLARQSRLSLVGWWCGLFVGWGLIGLSLWAAMQSVESDGRLPWGEQALVCTASAALGVVAGFLSLIPGGLVVRDAVILRLLAPAYGDAAALVGAVLVRLVWLVAELGISVILYVSGLRRRG